MSRETEGWVWQIQKNSQGKYNWDQCHASILMDIRDELKNLNRLLRCDKFLSFPAVLREIERHTRKPRKTKTNAKAKRTGRDGKSHHR